ncbi:molecular chaperone [Rahnella inusitata]|uniref:fimbrial biogenesis chaperone n=1 Tax=Rahnella inusitata TaxID=58169 RepID=UPI0039BE2776
MKLTTRILSLCALSISLAGVLSTAEASVVVSGTRLIYPANQHDVSIQLTNNDPKPALVQSWIDSGDMHQDPSLSTAPFVVTPPITRIDAGKKQLVRLTLLSSNAVPTDRESVYWYNMLDIPAKSKEKTDENILEMALRTRIKVFYRPEGLKGVPAEAATGLTWQAVKTDQGYALRAINPAAYNVSMTSVSVTSAGKTYTDDLGGMVAPKSSKDFPLKGLTNSPAVKSVVSYNWVNDYGNSVSTKSTVTEIR